MSSTGKSKKIIIIAVAALAVIAAAVVIIIMMLNNGNKGYANIGVQEIVGDVTVENNGDIYKAYPNMHLTDGFAMTTAKESFSRLVLNEDKFAKLEELSRAKFDAMGTGGKSTSISLEYGQLTNEISRPLKQGEEYKVSTPNAVLSVIGTLFITRARQDENGKWYTDVYTFGGSVMSHRVLPDGTHVNEQIPINAGFKTTIYMDDSTTIYIQEVDEDPDDNVDPIDINDIDTEILVEVYAAAQAGHRVCFTTKEMEEVFEERGVDLSKYISYRTGEPLGTPTSTAAPIPEDTTPEATTPEETSSEDTSAEETAPEDTTAEETTTTPEETTTSNDDTTVPPTTTTIPEVTIPEETIPEVTIPEETTPTTTTEATTTPETTTEATTTPEETTTVPETTTTPYYTTPGGYPTPPYTTTTSETTPETTPETTTEETTTEDTTPDPSTCDHTTHVYSGYNLVYNSGGDGHFVIIYTCEKCGEDKQTKILSYNVNNPPVKIKVPRTLESPSTDTIEIEVGASEVAAAPTVCPHPSDQTETSSVPANCKHGIITYYKCKVCDNYIDEKETGNPDSGKHTYYVDEDTINWYSDHATITVKCENGCGYPGEMLTAEDDYFNVTSISDGTLYTATFILPDGSSVTKAKSVG